MINETINALKLRAKNGEVTFAEACGIVNDALDTYIEKFGTTPPPLNYNHYKVNKKTSIFRVKKRSITTLEEIGDLLFYLAEKEEQKRKLDEAKKRKRDEWEEIEKKKLTSARMRSILQWYVHVGVIDEDRSQEIKKEYRECSYYECPNVYHIEDAWHQKYCSSRCYSKDRAAANRLRTTNTILRKNDYIDRLSQTIEEEHYKNVILVPNIDEMEQQP